MAQDKPRVELYTRHGDSQWLLTIAEDSQSYIQTAFIGCTLALEAIYENVDFGPLEEPAGDAP